MLARNVRLHRAIQQLSQGDLAGVAETNQMTISHIEARKANPTLAKIATALRVEVDALFAKPERGEVEARSVIRTPAPSGSTLQTNAV